MRRITACILLSCSLLTCRNDSTAPDTSKLQLSNEDVAVTEAWVRLHIASEVQREHHILSLRRNDSVIASIARPPLDTLFYLDGLQPKFTYKFQATLDSANRRTETSEPLYVTTMDTTSHDFSWRIDTLGDGANSSLRDVAIVNDSCVWVVGELHLRDSTGNFETTPYNAARWNGHRWIYERVYYVYQGQNFYSALYSIFAFGPNDIWIGSNQPEHWNGTQWEEFDVGADVFNGYINKIWGTSRSNMYIVGANGAVAHFDGSTWTRQESGTDVDLLDVWGSPDGSVVWTCGYYHSRPGTYLLRNAGTGWKVAYDGTSGEFTVRNDSLSGAYSSVFAPTKRRLYVAGAGVYQTTSDTRGEAKRLPFDQSLFPGFPNRLRGNASNDIVDVGDYNCLAHFNGVSWRYMSGSLAENRHLRSVDQKGNLIVGVGVIYDPINSKGLVQIGRR